MSLTDDQKAKLEAVQRRLKDDDIAYFKHCMKIRPKEGSLAPLLLNESQMMAHEFIEDMKKRTGKVRVLILKGRQQGISTYTEARFYKKTSLHPGELTMIVTQEDGATQNLFGMTKRYHDNCPDFMRPQTKHASSNELSFPEIDSSFKVATAGGRSVGRSATIQNLHVSEFDFWPDATADSNWSGLYEALAKGDGTECIIETTVQNPGGRFHRAWLAAERGETEFECLFIPWYVHSEYRTTPPRDWVPSEDWQEYREAHGLDMDQLYWAYTTSAAKAMTFGTDPAEICIEFKREYPAIPEDAFESAGDELSRVFPAAWTRAAMRRHRENRHIPLGPQTGLGADVAQGGKDKSATAPLHGVRFGPIQVLPGAVTTDGPAMAGMIIAERRDDSTIAIDTTGGWGGSALTHVKDHLDLPAIGVNNSEKGSGTSKDGSLKFKNMRAKIYWRFREALDPVYGDSVELPQDSDLAEEMAATTFFIGPGGIQIRPKDEIIELLGRSPDKLDAVVLAWHAGSKEAASATSSARRRRGAKNHNRAVNSHRGRKVAGRR